jgi:hypothetical protein
MTDAPFTDGRTRSLLRVSRSTLLELTAFFLLIGGALAALVERPGPLLEVASIASPVPCCGLSLLDGDDQGGSLPS